MWGMVSERCTAELPPSAGADNPFACVFATGTTSLPRVRQVEPALSVRPSIQNVAVVGMPDPRLGERVRAYVMLKADAAQLTVEDLKTYLLNLDMAIQKAPERVEIVGEMPTTLNGKSQKHVLRADIASKLEAAS